MEPDDIEKLIEVWRVLNVLTVSTDRLSEYWRVHGEEAAKEAIVNFTGPRMSAQIANARALMADVLEKQDPTMAERLDAMGEDEVELDYWDGPQYPSIDEQVKAVQLREHLDS